MLLIMFYLLLLLAIQSFYRHLPLVDSVRMAVVIAGLVPNGLFLAIAVAYALGAVRIAGKGALVQQSNAVESLSNVDMLCLDKTGTLTANRLQLNELCPLQASQEELKRLLGDFAASIPSGNRTNAAIAAAFPGSKHEFIEEVPFSSEWKWSALTYDKPEEGQTFILGAPEIVATALQKDGADLQAINSQVHNWARQGLRIVLFSRAPDGIDLYDADNHPQLPENLVPLGLVSLRDELRPEARQTLAAFAQSGVEVKIISGDNPDTVAALAIQAGLDQNLKTLSGRELSQLNGAQLVTAIEETRVFGRITPQQKNLILRTLREQGHYVAMVGDGVNDLLALKESNLGIAMQSGSQATRAVSDIVLLNDSFASLPYAVREGQRIIVGMQDILKLFMTRILFAALLILSTSVIGGFPFAPKHNSILTLFIVGIPTLALAYWAQPGVVRYHVMTRRLFHFVLPAGLTLSVATLGVFLYYMLPVAYSTVTQTARAATMLTAQTMVTQLSIFCGLLLVIFVEPPIRFLVGGDRLSNDWRPTWLAFGLLLVYIIVVSTPQIRRFFELVPLTFYDYAILACIAVAWAFLLRWIWRSRVLDRFLSVDFDLQETKAETALDIKESEE
jgi:cation-transporting ATPase E